MDDIRELKSESLAAEALLANLADIIGDDEDARADIIEGETSLTEIIGRLVTRLAEIDGLTEGIDVQVKKAQARKTRLKEQAEFVRVAIGSAMEQAGLKRVETALGTVSQRKIPPKALITEEADLPSAFLKTKVSPDLKAILDALKAGDSVPGATLSNGGVGIQIKGT